MAETLVIFFIVLFVAPIGIAAIWCLFNFVVIKQKEAMVVERWGKFHARVSFGKIQGSASGLTLFFAHFQWDAGLHWLCPMMDKPRRIVWREVQVRRRYLCVVKPKTHWLQSTNDTVKIRQERSARVDMRQRVMDFRLQRIITRDNVEIGVHPMLVFELVDPVRIAYEVGTILSRFVYVCGYSVLDLRFTSRCWKTRANNPSIVRSF